MIPSGRVCGTAIGMALSPTVVLTPSSATSVVTAALKASQRMSGSGPARTRNAVPCASWARCTASCGSW